MHNINNKALIHKTHRWWWLQQERVDRALQIKNKLNKFGWNESLTDCGVFWKRICCVFFIWSKSICWQRNKTSKIVRMQNLRLSRDSSAEAAERKEARPPSHTTILYIQHCNSLKSPGRPDLFLSTAFSPQHQRWYYGDLRMEKHECVYILKFLFWE